MRYCTPACSGSSPEIQRRIAVVEAGIALAASLLPTLEKVDSIYTRPAEKRTYGQTCLARSEQRITADVYTRRYVKVCLRTL